MNKYDRIERMIGVQETYKNVAIEVVVSPDTCATYNGQVMTFVSAKLINKWAKKLTIHLPWENDCLINRYAGKSVNDILSEENIEVSSYTNVNDVSLNRESLILLIGSNIENVADLYVWINSQGWLSGYGTEKNFQPVDLDNDSVIGASFAACLGVGELFRQSIGRERENFTKWVSLYDFTDSSDINNLNNPEADIAEKKFGSVTQIGCGAIGSCFDYLMSLCNDLSGNVDLIDFDKVEMHNVSASLVFNEVNAENATSKVELCKKEFENTNIEAQSFECDFEGYVSSQSNKILDLILCFANERNVWSTIQHNYPPLVIHATTTKTWGLNFGRHIPLSDWCLMCRFHDDIKQDFVPICSAGNISVEKEKEVLGMLPFLAAGSSVLVLAEIYRLQNALQYRYQANFVEFSMNIWQGSFLLTNYPPKQCYVCEDQDLSLYPPRVKQSKYWQLSLIEMITPKILIPKVV